MIDVSDKEIVHRRAVASGEIVLKEGTLKAIREGRVEKGDVLTVAKLSGLNAIKSTCNLIAMCHPIPLTYAGIELEVEEDRIVCKSEVRAQYKTGVEMEALTGASVALLTVWDMIKYLEKDERGQYPHTSITNLIVVSKEKGE
jgi:cyclic pyranopterin phosphate synthase